MSFIQDLFTENPMIAETKRFVRRFVGVRRGPQQAVVLVLIVLIYLVLIGLFASYREIEPSEIIYIQPALYCVDLPAMLQGSIAGAREKRTWET